MNSLKDILNKYANKPFLFVRPGGNWGDYLIYYGAETLANELNIKFTTLTKAEFLNSEINEDVNVYIHGGGAFNSWSSDAGFSCLEFASNSKANSVIYGPCTCSIDADFLKNKFSTSLQGQLNPNLYIFAREQVTYDIFKQIESITKNAQLNLDSDTAFHSKKAEILKLAGPERSDYKLYGYRIDKELPDYSYSKNIQFLLVDPPELAKSFEHWLRMHINASEIITNRTHSSILGAILGKKTTLFPSKYHKNRSIWENNLRDMEVQWIEVEDAENKVQPSGIFKLIPKRLLSSWKLNQYFLKLRNFPNS